MAISLNLGISAQATGTVDVITATYAVAPTLSDREILFLRTSGPNLTTTPTFDPNGLGAKTIVKQGGSALAVGDLIGDVILMYNSTSTQWELLNVHVPFIKDKTIILNTTQVSHTGTVAKTVKFTQSIPASTFTANDKINMDLFLTAVGGAGVKTIEVYLNTTADLAGSPVLIGTYATNNLRYGLLYNYWVDSATTMKSFKSGAENSSTFWGSTNSGTGTFTVDFAVEQFLVIAFTLANAGDTLNLQAISLERKRV